MAWLLAYLSDNSYRIIIYLATAISKLEYSYESILYSRYPSLGVNKISIKRYFTFSFDRDQPKQRNNNIKCIMGRRRRTTT